GLGVGWADPVSGLPAASRWQREDRADAGPRADLAWLDVDVDLPAAARTRVSPPPPQPRPVGLSPGTSPSRPARTSTSNPADSCANSVAIKSPPRSVTDASVARVCRGSSPRFGRLPDDAADVS